MILLYHPFQGKVTLKVRGTLIHGPLIIDVGVRSLFLKIASAIIYCFNIKRNIKVDCFTKHSTITITAIKPSLKCWGGFSNRYFQVYDYPALWDSVFDWLMVQSSKHQFETLPDVYCLNKYMHVFRLELSLFGNIFLWNSMIYTRSWKKKMSSRMDYQEKYSIFLICPCQKIDCFQIDISKGRIGYANRYELLPILG